MERQATKEYSYIGPRDVGRFHEGMKNLKNVPSYNDLKKIGVALDSATVKEMVSGLGMDSSVLQAGITTPSVPSAVQFLQNWLPGLVKQMTAARKIDELVGKTMVGDWEDEQIVVRRLEQIGTAVPYGDYTTTPFSSWNLNFETRNIARFEEGLRVGNLEERRAAKMQVNSANEKREAASRALEVLRNSIGFYGYNNAANRVYGFLNDPSLPSYITVATGAESGSPTVWAQKSFLEITADIRTAVAQLRTQLQGNLDEDNEKLTLALGTVVRDRLTVTSEFGNSVREWITENYPGMRIVAAPELNGANGGQNVFYLYAEKVENDLSTDDGRVFTQLVQTQFAVVGVSRHVKSYEEDYTNATAGVLCKRPYAVVRYTGI